MDNIKEVKDTPHLPLREVDSHKGDYGRVLVIAGSPGMTGAAYLAGKAALRSGSGLVTVACPSSLNHIMETKLTCVMTMPVAETKEHTFSMDSFEQLLDKAHGSDSVVLGPGISQQEETKKLTRLLIEKIDKPLVIDADALNNIPGNPEILKSRNAETILTPHPGEMARLTLSSIEDVQKDRKKFSVEFARKIKTVVILKGHNSIITDGSNLYVNKTGNPGMATAGSGDVLAGMTASFLARDFSGFEAARLAVWLHGLAGDIAAKETGQESLIATDILNNLPYAFMQLSGHEIKEWPGFIPGNSNK